MTDHPQHTWGHTAPFGLEYHRATTDILSRLRDDWVTIAEVANSARDTLRRGGTVYMNVATGHMPSHELVSDREGSPGIFHVNTGDANTPEEYDAMQAGDMLLTNRVSEAVRTVRDRGVYVVVFTTCYVNNRNTPPGKVKPNENGHMPEDVATRVIDSHIPWDQGLLHVPEIPTMPVLPSSGTVTCTIHWMITAEVAHAMATDTTPDGSEALRYVNILLKRLAEVRESEWRRIAEVAPVIAERIIGGGRYFVRSRNHGVESECSGVAAGLRMVNQCQPRSADAGGNKDVMLIAAVSVDDPEEIAWADEAQSNRNLIIGVGQPGNRGLRGRCNVYLDDRCPEAGGVIPVPGRDDGVSPATGIINNVLTQMINAQFVDEMCRRGAVPGFYMGYYRTLGEAYNQVTDELLAERGY